MMVNDCTNNDGHVIPMDSASHLSMDSVSPNPRVHHMNGRNGE